ncbi:hypothetical protein SLEP1_g35663 [Rubroshorea leprosula]|uniref:Uncharacterized protein n=1 Tax=Rubroshorea leprosula TaxID=152421 RepID=A0AAV5KNU8_9ROSI|nr:hypothetical protein SLEP1_g35663 [Rubroshorea leprosula]
MLTLILIMPLVQQIIDLEIFPLCYEVWVSARLSELNLRLFLFSFVPTNIFSKCAVNIFLPNQAAA